MAVSLGGGRQARTHVAGRAQVPKSEKVEEATSAIHNRKGILAQGVATT